MRIKTKLESIEAIKKLGLNQFPKVSFASFNESEIRAFFSAYPSEFYVVRDNNTAHSSLFRILPPNELLEHCKANKMVNFSIAVAAYNHNSSQILTGDVCIHKNMVIDYIISNNPKYTTRDVLRDPDYNGSTNVFDKKLKKIRGFKEIVDYIFEHELMEVIVEFAVFSNPIGIKNEKVVIWELRTDY